MESVSSSIGRGVMSVGTMLVNLKPLDVRKESVEEVIERLRGKMAKLRGIRAFFIPAQDVQIGVGGIDRYQYAVTGLNQAEVVRWGRTLLRHFRHMPQTTDAIWNYDVGGIEPSLLINRARAAEAGVSISDIDNILYDWLGQRQIGTIRLPYKLPPRRARGRTALQGRGPRIWHMSCSSKGYPQMSSACAAALIRRCGSVTFRSFPAS